MKNASSHKNIFYTGYAVFLYSGKVKKGQTPGRHTIAILLTGNGTAVNDL